MTVEEHKHTWKNGFCSCGAESKRGFKRRIQRERNKIAADYRRFELYEALCAKDGKQALDFNSGEVDTRLVVEVDGDEVVH